jgi:hypothetical protein
MSKDKDRPINLIESAGIPKIKKAPGKEGNAAASANIPTMELAPGTKKAPPKKTKGK